MAHIVESSAILRIQQAAMTEETYKNKNFGALDISTTMHNDNNFDALSTKHTIIKENIS